MMGNCLSAHLETFSGPVADSRLAGNCLCANLETFGAVAGFCFCSGAILCGTLDSYFDAIFFGTLDFCSDRAATPCGDWDSWVGIKIRIEVHYCIVQKWMDLAGNLQGLRAGPPKPKHTDIFIFI